MDRPVELVPLACLQCATPIAAQVDEIAWACARCGLGLYLDVDQGLERLALNYAAGIPGNGLGLPYWVVKGQVQLQRQTFSGDQDQQAERFWSEPRRFYVPAFQCSLETLLSQGVQLLQNPPALQPGSPARFQPVTLAKADLRAAVEFIVVALEAGRKDKLKEVRVDLHLEMPELWILPGQTASG
jgi:hypothetical protein